MTLGIQFQNRANKIVCYILLRLKKASDPLPNSPHNCWYHRSLFGALFRIFSPVHNKGESRGPWEPWLPKTFYMKRKGNEIASPPPMYSSKSAPGSKHIIVKRGIEILLKTPKCEVFMKFKKKMNV